MLCFQGFKNAFTGRTANDLVKNDEVVAIVTGFEWPRDASSKLFRSIPLSAFAASNGTTAAVLLRDLRNQHPEIVATVAQFTEIAKTPALKDLHAHVNDEMTKSLMRALLR